PQRIQRKREKGWRMPPNTVYVGRPGYFGNPISVGDYFLRGDPGNHRGPFRMCWCVTSEEHADDRYEHIDTAQKAVDAFRFIASTCFNAEDLQRLRGKNLACWCP